MTTALFLLYKGKERLSSRFIAWWQRSDFSHVERVLRVDLSERTGMMRLLCGSSSMMDGGVRTKWIVPNPDHWELWAIDGDFTEGDAWFKEHDGERYDLFGLLGFVFRRIKGALRAWWCSEACMASAGAADPWRFDVASMAAVLRTLGRPIPLR